MLKSASPNAASAAIQAEFATNGSVACSTAIPAKDQTRTKAKPLSLRVNAIPNPSRLATPSIMTAQTCGAIPNPVQLMK
jgi:hypothetical protein